MINKTCLNFQKGTLSPQNSFDQMLARLSTILYRKLVKFGIQEELLLGFLDTKFH